jgi:putative peptidoglycan lipid II flippase
LKRLAGAAVLLVASSLLGIAINFGTQAYLAYRFGAGPEMDAYVAAMTLPALFSIVVIPSLGVVLIPLFVESMHHRGVEQTWNMASTVFNVTAVVVTGCVAAAVPLAGTLMRFIAPGLDAPTWALASTLLQWLLPATILGSLAAIVAGLYQAEERFLATAIAPLAGAAVLLCTAVVLAPRLGMRGVAIATVVGSAVQLACLLPVFKGHYTPRFDIRDRSVQKIGSMLLPLIFGGLIYRATIVADRVIASLLPIGSLSHLEYANRITAVFNLLFASGIATALYPRMSAQGAAGDLPRLRETLLWGQRILMMFLFPALAVGWALRVPLLNLMLQRGSFMAADSNAVAGLLTWFMLGAVGGTLGVLQARIYYILKDTVTPVMLGFIETAAYIAYLPPLALSFGASGVAMANAAYLLSAFLLNGVVVLRKLHTENYAQWLTAGGRLALFSIVAGAAAWGVAATLNGTVIVLVCGSAVGGACYLVLLLATRSPELRDLRSIVAEIGVTDGQ